MLNTRPRCTESATTTPTRSNIIYINKDGDIVEVKDESGRVQKKLVKPKTQVLIRMLKQRDENIALQTQLLMDGPALHAIKTHMNRVGDDDMIFKEH